MDFIRRLSKGLLRGYMLSSRTHWLRNLNQYVINLSPGKSLSLYVPHSLFPRFNAIRDIAHAYRHGETKYKTKIKYGTSDFVLTIKPKLTRDPWKYASLDSLPPLELSPYDGNLINSSPPSGRNRLSSKICLSQEQEDSQTSHRSTKARTNSPTTSTPQVEPLIVTETPLSPKDPASSHSAACSCSSAMRNQDLPSDPSSELQGMPNPLN